MGRAGELAAFGQVLAGDDPARVVALHGPAGVGKSALLRAFADLAVAAGRRHLPVDLRSFEASPDAFLGELAAHAWDEHRGPTLITVDTFERAGALEEWLHRAWLPSLPGDVLVALAGREPPSPTWRRDPGWSELLRVIAVRNLAREETAELLRRAGVDPTAYDRAVELTHGHALAVSLLAEVLRRRPAASLQGLGDAPDVLGPLVAGFLDAVPDTLHERALQVCAHAWATTADLLAEALGLPDATELLRWLRGLSFVDEGPYGVYPHDLARDALEADLRWRDPSGFATLHRSIQQAVLSRARELTGADQQRAIMHVVFAHRHSPLTAAYWDYDALGSVYADAVRPADHRHLLDMVERHQGPEQARIADHWLQRQPAAFRVVRSAEPQPVGLICVLRLDLCDARDRDRDPAVDRALTALAGLRPLRPGDHATLMRFLVDLEHDQRPSRTLNLGPVTSIQLILTEPDLAWDLLSWSDTGAMDDLMGFIDYARLPEATYDVGTQRYAVFGHDFRRVPAEQWFLQLAERELGAPVPPASGSGEDVALPYPEFVTAVREALRELHRPERLASNPLTQSRMVRQAGRPGAATLTALLREQIESLRSEPRGEGLAAVLDRTYVRAAATQEAAAQVLDLPFSTYRRHLAKATDRLVERLWSLEI